MDWTKRRWDVARANAESKLYVTALAFAVARNWPEVASNAVDPGGIRTKMGGASAPVDIETGQRTQTWLAVSNDLQRRRAAGIGESPPGGGGTLCDRRSFQTQLLDKLAELTGVSM